MRRVVKLLCSAAPAVAMLVSGPAWADQTFDIDNLVCRAGAVTVLAKDEKKIVFALEHKGVVMTADPNHVLNNATQHCIGVIAVFDGKVSGNGWCKNLTAKTGDWALLDWASETGHGTWSFRHGTGVFKGISGSGTYKQMAKTRPIQAGTYQNCIKAVGTMKLPG
jgi:hypothetical protein